MDAGEAQKFYIILFCLVPLGTLKVEVAHAHRSCSSLMPSEKW